MIRPLQACALAFCVACGGPAPTGPATDAGDAGAIADARLDGGATPVGDAGPDAGTPDEAGFDAGEPQDAGSTDAGAGACSVDGEPGTCLTLSDCATLAGYESTPGYCPGPADVQCCRLVPNVADNPPVPTGWQLMPQSAVTPAMTAWAVAILNDPTDYPLFSTTTQTFGGLTVLARVEWHPPDSANETVHRGVTLYEPI
jgi:hypothetical protein